jgi:hypothetical protein
MLSKCPNCNETQKFFTLLFARRKRPVQCHNCGLILGCNLIYPVVYMLFLFTFFILFAAYSEYLSVTVNRVLIAIFIGVSAYMTLAAPLMVKEET